MEQFLSKKNLDRKIHFIGIAGTAMASLARAFSVAGFKVTGSDSNRIFPPMSDYLKKNKVSYQIGFNAKNVCKAGEVVVGNAHYSAVNPEIVFARENKIELEHFPRLVEKYLIKKNSVVVTGTYGKTTITSMLAWLFFKANKNPNYMLGGIPLNFNHGARLTPSNPPLSKGESTDWSVVEGDEYPAASPWDPAPKFDFYHPQFLVLTSAEWDHMDVYKTKKSYADVFKKLVARVPKNGLIVAKLDGENLNNVLKNAKCKIIYYTNQKLESRKQSDLLRPAGRLPLMKGEMFGAPLLYKEVVGGGKNKAIYSINIIKINGKNTTFTLSKNAEQIGIFTTQLLGDFNLENWCAALALCLELKIDLKILQKAVGQFKGVKRRLEIRAQKNNIIIIDDFAHNPSKARQSVLALKKHFPDKKIYIIFEPNRGGRSINCMEAYNNIFTGVDKIFIPKLSNYKVKQGVVDVSGLELARHLRKTHKNVAYEEKNEKIFAWLKAHAKPGTVIAFLGSRDFGGMLEKISKSV